VSLQNEIAKDVSNKLKAKLSGTDERSLAKGYAVNPEAYQLYLQGRYHWNKRSREGIRKAGEYFQKAIEKDPRYPLAYVGLADSYIVGENPGADDLNAEAKAAALKALELEPTLGEAHAVLANVAFYNEWDWPTAEREYKRAMELSPNYATAHHWYGEGLSAMGRFDESFAEYQHALDLDPLSLAISTDLGRAYYVARQYDRAIEHLKKVEEMDPNYVRTHYYLATAYEEKGMFEEAMESRRKGIMLDGGNIERLAKTKNRVLKAIAASGANGYWRTMLELAQEAAKRKGEPVDSEEMSGLYALLNEPDKSFEWLEKMYVERRSGLMFLNVDPNWDNLHSDPRFSDLVRRVGLPQ